MIPEHLTNDGMSRWDALMFSFSDRWDRPWNTLTFMGLSGFLWAVYALNVDRFQFELFTVMLTLGTVAAFWDLFDTIRVPRKVRLPGDMIEAERLFLPRVTWSKSDVEVHEKAGGLVIVNRCSPKRSRFKDTLVLPADYPRLDEIRELLAIDEATKEPYGAQKTHPADSEGPTAAEDEDSRGTEDSAGGRE